MRITNPVIKFGDFKDNLKDILKDTQMHLLLNMQGHKGYTYIELEHCLNLISFLYQYYLHALGQVKIKNMIFFTFHGQWPNIKIAQVKDMAITFYNIE